jgi:hypothetical protein
VNVLEVKFHKKGEQILRRSDGAVIGEYEYDQWNVHYHILFDGDFIPQGIAQDQFSKATGGESFYTYIKACAINEPVRYKKSALTYVLKYLGKVEGVNNDPRVLAQFYEATKGLRFYNVGFKKADRERLPEKQKLTCNVCGSQQWYARYTLESKDFEKLLSSAVTREGASFAPAREQPVREHDENSCPPVEVAFDDVSGAGMIVRVSRKTMVATYLREHGPTSFADLVAVLEVSESRLESLLEKMARDGEIFSIRPGEWMVLE